MSCTPNYDQSPNADQTFGSAGLFATLVITPGSTAPCTGNDSFVIEFTGANNSTIAFLNITNTSAVYCNATIESTCASATVAPVPTSGTTPAPTSNVIPTTSITGPYLWTGTYIASTGGPAPYFMTLTSNGVFSFGSGSSPSGNATLTFTDLALANAADFVISVPSSTNNGVTVNLTATSTLAALCVTPTRPAGTSMSIANPSNALVMTTLYAGSSSATDLVGCLWAGALTFSNSTPSGGGGGSNGTPVFTLIFSSPTSVGVQIGTAATPTPVPFVNGRTLPAGLATGAVSSYVMYVSLRPNNVVWVGAGANPNAPDTFLASFVVPNASQITSVQFLGSEANTTGWYPTVTAITSNPESWEDNLRKYWWAIVLGVLALIAAIIVIFFMIHHARTTAAAHASEAAQQVELAAAVDKTQQLTAGGGSVATGVAHA